MKKKNFQGVTVVNAFEPKPKMNHETLSCYLTGSALVCTLTSEGCFTNVVYPRRKSTESSSLHCCVGCLPWFSFFISKEAFPGSVVFFNGSDLVYIPIHRVNFRSITGGLKLVNHRLSFACLRDFILYCWIFWN